MDALCSFEGCDHKRRKLEYCDGHYAQHRTGRALTPLKRIIRGPLDVRMAAYTDRSGDCWEWQGACTASGYGVLSVNGHQERAHRVAYELAHGTIPEGLVVDHMCRNRRCVRPEHLQAATNKENCENLSGATASSTSGVRGVYWHKPTRKWRGHVRHEGRQYSAGYFHTSEEAEAAVIALRNKLFTNNLIDRAA